MCNVKSATGVAITRRRLPSNSTATPSPTFSISQSKTPSPPDEPTTGLHFHEVPKLLEVLHPLTDPGNSDIIIEHNLDVIRNADWIIDLGPEGGEEGGRIVAQGTPEQVARGKKSYTGQALAGYFGKAEKPVLSSR